MHKRSVVIFAILSVIGAHSICRGIDYPVGERLTYRILWGFIPVGYAAISCEEVPGDTTPLIRIRVEAKSNRLISALYLVNDRIDSYIDPESGLPVRVEKKTSEGGYVCDDTLWFDRKNLLARWQSRSASIETNYPISSDTLDVAAFLYALRSVSFKLNEPELFNIATDGYLHGLTITAQEKKQMDIGSGNERKWCIRFSAIPERSDLFVRKIPDDIWVTDDARRIMVQMRTKIPVGHVLVVLDEAK